MSADHRPDRLRFGPCGVCGKTFTEESWDARHWGPSGLEVHAECCRWCPK